MDPRKKINILNVVYRMSRAGIETWLVNVLRNINREKFHLDFLVSTNEPGEYDLEIRNFGSIIIPCLTTERPLKYAHNLRKSLRKYGPYDFIHVHFKHYAGWVLRTAYNAGVPNRIAHSHNDTQILQRKSIIIKRLYYYQLQKWIYKYATAGLACSENAGISLYGNQWGTNPKWRTHYCGIDLQSFKPHDYFPSVRSDLGIPENAFVLGHVGRFEEQKNHSFLIDIFAEILKKERGIMLLLIGDGPLRPSIESKVNSLGLRKSVVFAGIRSDIPIIMKSAINVLLFPSLYEGLGLVTIEAQAAGLPIVCSDAVPEEADVVKSLIYRHALEDKAAEWAKTIRFLINTSEAIDRADSYQRVVESRFNINNSISELECFYVSEYKKRKSEID